MLAEIFFLRLEAELRASREAARFVPHPAAGEVPPGFRPGQPSRVAPRCEPTKVTETMQYICNAFRATWGEDL
jgi:hypothetical protein